MNTALLIIDMQQSLVDEGIWAAETVIARLNDLIAQARTYQVPIIFVRDARVEPHGELHRALAREADDIEIVKSFCDSFAETRLDELLKNRTISRLIVGGLQTDYCVDTTCRQAAARGYAVTLVGDAHSTVDNDDLKATQIIAHHNRILRNFNSSTGRVRVSDAADVSFL